MFTFSCESRAVAVRQYPRQAARAQEGAADQPRVPRPGHDRGRERVRTRHPVRGFPHTSWSGGEKVRDGDRAGKCLKS